MIDENELDNIACETICILEHCDKSFVDEIPARILNKLKSIAKNSSFQLKIHKYKKIEEQDISEDTKTFIALLYYNYVANSEERKEILKIWKKNDIIYNEEKNTNNLLKSKEEFVETKKDVEDLNHNTEISEYKENLFKKLLRKIKYFFTNKK